MLPPAGPGRGVLLMLAAAGTVACMHSLVRLASQELHPFQVAFLRSLIPFLLMLPLLLRKAPGTWRSRVPGLQLAMGALGAAAMLVWFTGLHMVPVAEATALAFFANVVVVAGAALLLGEKVGPRRWAAVAVGLLGALIIVRPGVAVVDPGALVVLASSLLWAGTLLLMKRVSRVDDSVTLVLYSSFYTTLFALPFALWFWQWPAAATWLVIGAIGCLAAVSHLLSAEAFKQADASLVMPLDYTRLLWAAAIGFLLFGEFPDLWTWVGGGVIVASACYISYREARLRRAMPRPPV